MGTPVNIGSTSYNVAAQGQRGWGPDTTALLLRLATVANQVVTSNYVLTSDTFFSDTSGAYGIKSNFLKGVGAIASADGFIRMASPHANPGQGLAYPGGTPEGKSYTYISWRNSTNSGDLHLFPNADNQTVQFNGRDFLNTVSVQTISNKSIGVSNVIDGGALSAGTVSGSAISDFAAIAYSKLAALSASKLLVSDVSGAVSASSVTSTEAGYLSGVTSSIQTQLNAKAASGNYITALTGNVVATGPGSAVATIQPGVVTNAMIISSAGISMNKLQSLGTSKAVATDSSGFLTTSATTNLELAYLSGVTSSVQTQINNKQTITANLTAIAAITDAGYLVHAGGGSWIAIDYLAVRAALSPLTTKGDLWTYDTVNTRLPIGTNNYVLTADSTAPTGMAWKVATGGTFTASSVDVVTNKSISGATNTLSAIPITALNTFTSAQLATQLTDETGSGANVFATSPTLVTPVLGTPTSVTLTNATGLPLTTGVTGTLGLTNGGTGQTTANAAFNALAPSQTSQTGKFLQTDGSNTSWVASSGGLSAVTATANVTTAVPNTMYSCTSTGGFTITLPTIPALGAVIGVMDAGETCSATNFIRITPATGQSIDGLVANDSLLMDFVRANVTLYAAPGATSWKVQYQTTSMVQAATSTVDGTVKARKQYITGTAYTNGTPALSLTAGGGTLTTSRVTLVPYQTVDGAWRLTFNMDSTLSSATRTTHALTISGVTFKTGFVQFVNGGTNQTAFANVYAAPATGSVTFNYASTTVTAGYAGGDVELDGKPTWAD